MGILDTPPSIGGIKGLNNIFQNQGWQLIAGTGMNLSHGAGTNTLSPSQRTTRANVLPTYDATHIILVFANYSGYTVSGTGEYPGVATIKINCSLEYSAIGSETGEIGQRIPVTFQGRRFVEIEPDAQVFSDPIPFNAYAGVPFFVRTCVTTNGSNIPVLGGYTTSGGVSPGSIPAIGEGYVNSNVVDTGSVTQLISGVTMAPVAIMGHNKKAVSTAGIMGDSICDGTSDGGMPGSNGGYLQRAVSGQLNRIFTYPITPPVAYVKCARGGEVLADFATVSKSFRRMKILELASTIVCEYGRNDLGVTSLATIKANYLAVANRFLSRGKNYVACTLVPNVSCTDGFVTTTNQTKYATESDRIAFNTWIRDTSSNGFIKQTNEPSKCAIFDAAASVEVNSSNVLTQNGGYWRLSGSPIITGTITSVTSALVFKDVSKTLTQDQYRGYVLRITSGVASNSQSDILSNSTTGDFSLVGVTGFTTPPGIGDTYQIFDAYTVEGIHPSTKGHMTIAATFPISLIK